MKRVTQLVLMLCLILSGALCYANGATRPENEKREGKGIINIVKKTEPRDDGQNHCATSRGIVSKHKLNHYIKRL